MKHYTRAVEALLALTRAGMYGTGETLPGGLTTAEWEEVYRQARRQTVTGLAWAGLRTATGCRVPPAVMARWAAAADDIEERSRRMERTTAGVCADMEAAGLRTLLLKGQAVARHYREPLLRECGDIDVCLAGGDDFQRAARAVGRAPGFKRGSDGSVAYRQGEFIVEIHPRITGVRSPGKGGYIGELAGRTRRSSLHLGAEVTVPAPEVEIAVLSLHILSHAIGRGIGLRQFCDAAMAMRKATDEERGLAYCICKRLGAGRWHRLLEGFIGAFLGENTSGKEPTRDMRWLLDRTLEGGNFGQKDKNNKQGRARTAMAFARAAGFSMRYAPAITACTALALARRSPLQLPQGGEK